jgi:hypothetical protein
MCRFLFASDTVNGSRELLPLWKTPSPATFPPYLYTLLSVRPVLDYALIAVFCSPFLFIVPLVRALSHHLRHRQEYGTTAKIPSATQDAVLLLLLFLLPGLTLSTLDLLTHKPFLTPMYVMYSSIAAYIAVGAVIGALKCRWVRTLGLTGVVVLYTYQLVLLLPFTTRTDWKSAARHIADNACPGDLVLDIEYLFPGKYIRCYLKDESFAVRRVTTFQAACDESAAFLEGTQNVQAKDMTRRSTWIVFEQTFIHWMYPAFDLRRVVSEALTERGLEASQVEFPGQYNLVLFRVSRNPQIEPKTNSASVLTLAPIDYTALLLKLGINSSDEAVRTRFVTALRNEVMIWPPLGSFFVVVHSMDLLAANEPELAEAMAREALARKPTFGLGHFALGLARAAQHDDTEAMALFRMAFREHPGLRSLFGQFVLALCETKCYDEAHAEIEGLERMGFLLTPALHEACRLSFQAN